MSEEKKSGLKLFDKLKKIKHIEIYIAIIFIVILVLIYMSTTKSNNVKNKESPKELTITSYVEQMETNLQDILSQIKGVSNVKVMITLDIASASVQESNIVLDKFPQIKGVVVTAKGVENTATKLKVLKAVETVIDITNGRIEILSSE